MVPSLIVGGAQRVFVTILRHLDREAFEPHLALLQASGPYLADVPPDVPVHVLDVSRVRYAMPAIVRLIWKLRPEAVISTLIHLNFLLASSKAFWPAGVRLFIRETITVSRFLEEEVRQPMLWNFWYRRLYGRADAIVCQCNAMCRDLTETFGIRAEKMVQIYNPVETGRLHVLVEDAQNPYDTARPNLIAVGRLENQKGFDLLLEAMALVIRTCPSACLTILGDGPLREPLQKQREILGLSHSVRFVGFLENPFPYYRWADLFVLTSKYEGLPNAMLEAIALGTRALATDCRGGVQEIVDLFPEFAVRCERHPSALAEHILAWCRDTSKTGARLDAARARFESIFGVNAVIGKYAELLGSD